jgi:hypothetical protein
MASQMKKNYFSLADKTPDAGTVAPSLATDRALLPKSNQAANAAKMAPANWTAKWPGPISLETVD